MAGEDMTAHASTTVLSSVFYGAVKHSTAETYRIHEQTDKPYDWSLKMILAMLTTAK